MKRVKALWNSIPQEKKGTNIVGEWRPTGICEERRQIGSELTTWFSIWRSSLFKRRKKVIEPVLIFPHHFETVQRQCQDLRRKHTTWKKSFCYLPFSMNGVSWPDEPWRIHFDSILFGSFNMFKILLLALSTSVQDFAILLQSWWIFTGSLSPFVLNLKLC